MYCPKCGANNPENAFTCTTCGTPLQGAQGGVKRVSMPDGNQLRFANPGGYTPAPIGSQTTAGNTPAPKKSHKKAAVITLSCIGGFLVLCAALVLIFLPQLERAVLGETVYYLYRETDTVKTLLSSDYVQALTPNKTFSATTQITAEASINSESLSAQMQVEALMLKESKINAQIDYNAREKKAAVDLAYLLKGKSVASARIDAEEDAIGVSLPKLADGQLAYHANMEKPDLKEITGYSETALLGMLKDIGEATEAGVGLQDKTVTGKEMYNGKNCRYTEIKLDEEDLYDAAVAALDAFLNNPDAVQAFKNTVAYESAYYAALGKDLQDIAEMMYLDDAFDLDSDDLLDELKDLRDELKDLDVDSDTEYIFKVYYTSRGDIVSRTFTVKQEDGDLNVMTLDTAFSGKKTDVLFTASEEWEDDGEERKDMYTFTLTAEEKSGKLAGTAKLVNKYNGESETYFTVDFTDVAVQKCGGLPLLTGQVNGKFDDGEMKFSLISSVSGNQSTVTGKLTEGDAGSTSVTVASEVSKSADVSDVTVADKSTMDFDSEALEKASQTVSDKLEEIIGDDVQKIYDSYYASYYNDYDDYGNGTYYY